MLLRYLKLAGAVSLPKVASLFGWETGYLQRLAESLVEEGHLAWVLETGMLWVPHSG